MNQSVFDIFKSKIRLQVSGKNIERFIRRLHQHQIDILNITYQNYKTVILTIYEKDYQAILELKTVYEVDMIDATGMIHIKRKIKKSRFFLIGLALGFCFLYFLSHVIFSIEIVHTNKELRTLLLKELDKRGIRERTMKKDFSELEKIKEDIVNHNRDKIEWLEIEAVGTKYVIRVEMRKIEQIKETGENRNVVAKKSAVLRKVEATKGEIIRNTNDYVKAGDVVITGDLRLNEETKNKVSAEGHIYGEVWYKVTVSYPFAYREVVQTGKKQTAYTLQLFDHSIQLFPLKYYKTKQVEKKKLLFHSFLPLGLRKELQLETREIDEVNTEDEAIAKAGALALKKMKSQLSDKEEIISTKNLKVEVKKSKIELEVFFTVLEDITSYQNIIEENEEIESSR